jgi:hypothetical protein
MLVAVRYACRGSRFTSGWADGPPPGYQPPVPAQDGLRCHQHPGPPGPGKAADQRCDHRPVRPGQLRPRHLPVQDGQLMPQHEDLSLLGGLRPRQQHHPAGQPA